MIIIPTFHSFALYLKHTHTHTHQMHNKPWNEQWRNIHLAFCPITDDIFLLIQTNSTWPLKFLHSFLVAHEQHWQNRPLNNKNCRSAWHNVEFYRQLNSFSIYFIFCTQSSIQTILSFKAVHTSSMATSLSTVITHAAWHAFEKFWHHIFFLWAEPWSQVSTFDTFHSFLAIGWKLSTHFTVFWQQWTREAQMSEEKKI